MSLRSQRILSIIAMIIAIFVASIAIVNYNAEKSKVEALEKIVGMSVSDESDVRAGAVSEATRYYLDDRMSGDLFARIITGARASADDEMRRALSQSLWQVSQERGHDQLFRSEIKKGRILIDVRYEDSAHRDTVKKIIDNLKGESFLQGPFAVSSRQVGKVDKSELRCFEENCENDKVFRDVVLFLKEQSIDVDPTNKMKILRQPLMYINSYEVWLTPEDIKSFESKNQVKGGMKSEQTKPEKKK